MDLYQESQTPTMNDTKPPTSGALESICPQDKVLHPFHACFFLLSAPTPFINSKKPSFSLSLSLIINPVPRLLTFGSALVAGLSILDRLRILP